MSLALFLVSVIFISLSGVLMPGPITAITIAKGSKNAVAGALVSLGHGVVEFPLIALIYFGLGAVFQIFWVKFGIGILGGGVLVWMAIDMLKRYRSVEIELKEREMGSILAGILLSAGNPYFLIWWATVGARLVLGAMEYGLLGLVLLALVHWFCDLFWYQFLSWLSFQGGRFFGKSLQMGVFIICGLAMLYFGLWFLADAGLSLFWSWGA